MGLVHDHPHRWPDPLHALEHKEFRALWVATFVSNCGTWMQKVAVAWLIYTAGGSAMWLGIDAALSGLPALILLPIGGVLADRVDRRRVLISSNIVNASVSLVLALLWWFDALTIWPLLVASFVGGVAASLSAPANQSIVPTVAGEDHLRNAVALNSFQYNLARAAGPAVGGLAFAWLGAGGCFLLNAASFVGLIAALAFVHATAPKRTGANPIESWLEGARFALHTPELRRPLIFIGLIAFGGAPLVTLLPAVAQGLLAGSADAYATLLTGFGVGAALAGIGLTLHRAERPVMKWTVAGTAIVGLCHIVISSTQSLIPAVAVCGLAGAAFVGTMIELGTALLAATPDAFRGRVSALQQLCFRTLQPLGGFVAAACASGGDLQTTLFGFGLVLLLTSIITIGVHLSWRR